MVNDGAANPVPETVSNWIGGKEVPAASGEWIDKHNPHDGTVLCRLARSAAADVDEAVKTAKAAQPDWGWMPTVKRGDILHKVCNALEAQADTIAKIVALETGKSYSGALGETGGAIALGRFYAGEGQRMYGRTTTSGADNKIAMTVREPLGVAGLIIAANTPIANVAWKVFPALVCGNSVVLKAAEDTPATAWIFAKIAHEAGLPAGVLNVVNGYGQEAGAPIVEHPDVPVISFTGSTAVGKYIARTAGDRLAKVSLELGGKNPLVVCDDADLDNAVKWVILSAFSNAGQRCASGSRIIVFDSVYDEFREKLVEKTKALKVGPGEDDDFGPVINGRQLENMLAAVKSAADRGARVVTGGSRLQDDAHRGGYYIEPTIVEEIPRDDEFSTTELFGPITALYRVKDFAEALEVANDSPYGLTASIHTRSYHRAWEFSRKVAAGVAVVNAGTFGSEPHMPFGGVKQSGNGSREPGTEALDIYSNLKDLYMIIDPDQV